MNSNDWVALGSGLAFIAFGAFILRDYDASAARYEKQLAASKLLSSLVRWTMVGGSPTSRFQRLQARALAVMAILIGVALIIVRAIYRFQ